MFETFQTLRAVLAGTGALFCFVAGHSMRAQGSGVNFSFGLLAYAAGLALLAYAAAGVAVLNRPPERGRSADGHDRDHDR